MAAVALPKTAAFLSDRSGKADQIAVAERDPVSDFNGKFIAGKGAVQCLFVSEASYLTAGRISAFCDPPGW